jgi:mono/diheme cytochrome c family protein
MTRHTRLIATIALAIGSSASFILAQGAPAQTPQTQAPAGQTPPPAGGRGEAGQRGAGQGGRQGGGGRRGGFTQFTRELAPPDVLVRGKSLYEANCASCHASDLRGGPKGTNAAIGNRPPGQPR